MFVYIGLPDQFDKINHLVIDKVYIHKREDRNLLKCRCILQIVTTIKQHIEKPYQCREFWSPVG